MWPRDDRPAHQPTGSPLGDALDALGRAVTAVVRRIGPIAKPCRKNLPDVNTDAGTELGGFAVVRS